MKKSILKSLTFAGLGSFCAFVAHAATSLFSDYGQIQNVQNYSSNPFWTPNAPYNQRLPQPVYVQGADLNTEDCMRAVQSLVSVQCMARNNCRNTTLNEIRPTIMVQLSNLPGNNYVSACSGYIDGAFESYVAQYGNGVSGRAVSFPTGTVANPTVNENTGLQLKNPYKQTVSKKQAAINERAEELQRLQEQNGSGSESLSSSAFPTTYADFSFSQRVENTREGLMPYKDMKAYQTPKILGCEEWCDDHANSPECITCRAKAADCTDTLNRFEGDHIVRAEWGTDTKSKSKTKVVGRVCKIVLCESGWEPDTHGEKCIQHKDSDCTDELKETVDHINSAKIDEKGICKLVDCEDGWVPNANKDKCVEELGKPCKLDPTPAHATEFRTDGKGHCIVANCEDGWTVNAYKDGCDEKPEESGGDGGGGGGEEDPSENKSGEDCKDTVLHALKARYNSSGECIVTQCESDFHVSKDNKKCYMDSLMMRIFDDDEYPESNEDYQCYATVTTMSNGEKPFNKAIKKFTNGKSVCVMDGSSNAVVYCDTLETVQLPLSKLKEIQVELSKITNNKKTGCDKHPDVDVYLYEDTNNEYKLKTKIRLDD